MTLIHQCPDISELEALLNGQLSDESEIQLRDHIESCGNCQQRIDELDAGDASLPGLGEHLGGPSDTLDSALQVAIEEINSISRDGGLDPVVNRSATSLNFLSCSDAPDSIGRLGRYEISDIIGRGGMGLVLKGYDPQLKRVVAIKVLSPELASNPNARKRFRREGQAAAAVSHDHVVTIHGVDEANGLPHLVMEYVSGQSLQDRIDQDGPLELKEILRIGMQAASGLAAAHAQGLVHRDIKPANILLENGVERVKITDFGLARAVDDVHITRQGVVAGTPEYMSPEQAQSEPVDHRSDLFSLGCVLYVMCTGRPPFRAESTVAMIRRVCDHEPRAIREVNADIPDPLANLVSKLLAKDSDDRLQSASEVSELLGKYLAHVQQPETNPCPEDTALLCDPSEHALELANSHRMRIVFAAILLVTMVGLSVSEGTGVTTVAMTVIRLVRGEGTLVIEVTDPEVSVALNGDDLIISGAGLKELRLPVGQYELEAKRNGRKLKQELVTIARDDRSVIRISTEATSRSLSVRNVDAPLGIPSYDGQSFTFVDWETGDLAIHDLGTGQVRRLTQNGRWTGQFAGDSKVSRAGNQVAYVWVDETASSKPVSLRVVSLNDDAATPRHVFSDDALTELSLLDWSPNEKVVLVELQRGIQDHQIGLIEIESGDFKALKRLGRRNAGACFFSPDGRYVVYDLAAEDEGVNRDIFVMDLETSQESAIVQQAGTDYVLGWTPSGRHVLFNSDRTGNWDSWVIRVSDGQADGSAKPLKLQIGPIQPLGFTQSGTFFYAAQTPNSNIYSAAISPDTGQLSAPPEKLVTSFIGRNQAPAWSPDGKRFSYVSRRGPFAARWRAPWTLVIHSEGTETHNEFSLDFITPWNWLWPRWHPCEAVIACFLFCGVGVI